MIERQRGHHGLFAFLQDVADPGGGLLDVCDPVRLAGPGKALQVRAEIAREAVELTVGHLDPHVDERRPVGEAPVAAPEHVGLPNPTGC